MGEVPLYSQDVSHSHHSSTLLTYSAAAPE